MQREIPQVLDTSAETKQTLDKYGIGAGLPTDRFGQQCLIARRMAEAGVRFIELTSPVGWDHHFRLNEVLPVFVGKNRVAVQTDSVLPYRYGVLAESDKTQHSECEQSKDAKPGAHSPSLPVDVSRFKGAKWQFGCRDLAVP